MARKSKAEKEAEKAQKEKEQAENSENLENPENSEDLEDSEVDKLLEGLPNEDEKEPKKENDDEEPKTVEKKEVSKPEQPEFTRDLRGSYRDICRVKAKIAGKWRVPGELIEIKSKKQYDEFVSLGIVLPRGEEPAPPPVIKEDNDFSRGK